MKRIILVTLLASLSWQSEAAELPLKRVVLSTAGLAQFTYSGEAAAGAATDLTVRLDQVDDVLKSLTIFDTQGAIGAVSLPGKFPLAQLFRDLPFGPEALSSQSALLNALVGAEVEIEGDVSATGKIFRVEEEKTQHSGGGQTVRHRLTIISDKGLVDAILEDLTALRFTDPQTREQIDRALAGMAQNRAKERRTLSINFAGQGTRQVGFSYVVASPVWKTSYRLVLPKEGGKARLQGWAIIENLTGSDWKDVELTLVSGNPVALKQPLYSAYFADRPEVPIAASIAIFPKKDDAAAQERTAESFAASAQPRARAKAMLAAPAPALGASAADGGQEEMAHAALAAAPEEASSQVFYRFPAKISLASGSTMMVPFVDGDISASGTYLYQPETNATRPLAAVRLSNDGDSALTSGIVTAFDTGADGRANFVGDAQLPFVSKGDHKLLTFALDSKTDIHRVDNGVSETRFGKAVRGQLTLTVRSRWGIDYEITPPADEDREIVIDEARQDGWKPAAGMKDVEETGARLRYKVMAPKGNTIRATLTQERTESQTVILTALGPEELLAAITGLQNETPALKDAIARLSGLVAGVNELKGRRHDLETERKNIAEDQERIRRNLATIGQGSDLGRRYLDALKAQEDRLAAIATEDKAIDGELAGKRKSAEDLAQNLTL
jgi:hypothetical protein